MREAMRGAVVGDDVFGDDPTVRELEAHGAAMLGKEAALFLPSGTMANQVAVRVHTRPGDEVLLEQGCHVYRFEQGGLAALHGVQAVPLPGERGLVPLELLRTSVRADDVHMPRTRLIVLENTHNLSGGSVLPRGYMQDVRCLADELGLRVHMDGARLANAAAALGCELAELAVHAHTTTLCLSKGLGAPVGSLLAGSAEFISNARRARKLLGGGMRQAGVLAAAGLLAMGPNWRERMLRDHELARAFAARCAPLRSVRVIAPETNLVVVEVHGLAVARVLEKLRSAGVLAVGFGPQRIRFAMHQDVGEPSLEAAFQALASALEEESD
jgi:threonine aldolase